MQNKETSENVDPMDIMMNIKHLFESVDSILGEIKTGNYKNEDGENLAYTKECKDLVSAIQELTGGIYGAE